MLQRVGLAVLLLFSLVQLCSSLSWDEFTNLFTKRTKKFPDWAYNVAIYAYCALVVSGTLAAYAFLKITCGLGGLIQLSNTDYLQKDKWRKYYRTTIRHEKKRQQRK